MRKRIISIVLALCLILGAVPVKGLAASGPEIIDSGVCGDNLTWTLDGNGLLIIDGIGDMLDFRYGDYSGNKIWHGNQKRIKEVIIKDGILSIGDYAFYNCTELTKITIPYGVKKIGSMSFYRTQITNLNIPNSVVSIGIRSFLECKKIENIFLPETVTSIGTSAFQFCENLTAVTILGNVNSFGRDVFDGCINLSSANLVGKITYIGDYAFCGCRKITKITIPNGVTSIGIEAFSKTSLESITIPSSVKTICHSAFGNYSKLQDTYYEGTKKQWEEIFIEYDNASLTSSNIHYNSTGPSGAGTPTPSPSPELGEITLRTDKDNLLIGEELPITASMRTPSDFTEGDITWSSSDKSIATVTPTGALVGDYTSATAVIKGVSEGTVTITAILADGRTGSYTVKVVPTSGLPLKDYNEYIYRADLLLDRDNPMKDTYAGIKTQVTPCNVFIENMKNDYSLLYSANAWEDVNRKLSTLAEPSSEYDYAFKEKDFYTALILDVLQVSTSDTQENWVEDTVGSVKDLNSGIKSFLKLNYNIDNFGGLTDKQKQEMEEWIKEYFHEKVSFGRWDTGNEAISALDKVFEHYGTMMDVYSEVESFVEHAVSAYALIYMSESTKSVVRLLYDNSGDIPALNSALSDIVYTMSKSEDDLFYKLVNDGLEIVGVECGKKLVDKLWDTTIMDMSPEIKLLVSVYKANKWVINQLGNVDAISEQCHNIIMMKNFEKVLKKTEETLVREYNSNKNANKAAEFLSCVDIEFATWKKDCQVASAFAKAVDSDSTPLKEGLKPKIIEAFLNAALLEKPSNKPIDKYEKIENSIASIKSSYSQIHDSLWNGWIYELEADYPDSGLFEKNYDKLIPDGTQPNSAQKKVVVACPVNVNVYKNGKLIAYTTDDEPFCAGDMTIAVVGDEKTLYFYDDGDYRLECVGTATGVMDVSIEEYDANRVQISNVEFRNIPLTVNKVYQTEISREGSSGTEYILVADDGTIIKPDENIGQDPRPSLFTVSFDPNGGTGSMASIEVKGSNTVVLPECGFSAQEGKKFAGWRINGSEYAPGMLVQISANTVVSAIWEDDTQLPTEIILPFTDVPKDAWYLSGVQYVYKQGLMVGTTSTKFSPNGTTTRGQIVTILYRLEQEPAVSTAGSFTDVPIGKWYSKAVEWAAKNQIVKGYGSGRFGPEDHITREQMVAILHRYAKYKGLETSRSTSLSGYSDLAKVSAYAVEPMRWAVAEGIISGLPGKKLGPTAKTNRAEVAVILKRFCST